MKIETLLLTVALALPGTHYRAEMTDDDKARVEEIRKIRDFINSVVPGADIVIPPKNTPKDRLRELGLERVPLVWRGNMIYIRRPPVYDRRIRGAA